MSTPGIELRWGGCEIKKWGRGHKRAVRPTMTQAVELVTQGIEHFGIDYEQPKLVSVWGAARNYPYVGHAFDSQHCDVYISKDAIKHRKVSRMAGMITQRLFHETVHMIYFERFPRIDLLALVASEGLACSTEYFFTESFLPEEDASELSYTLAHKLDEDEIAWLREGLFEDLAEPGEFGQIHDGWFQERVYYDDLTGGEAIGIRAVSDILKTGRSIIELMNMSPEEIVGIE